jgi:hypothetical protein
MPTSSTGIGPQHESRAGGLTHPDAEGKDGLCKAYSGRAKAAIWSPTWFFRIELPPDANTTYCRPL